MSTVGVKICGTGLLLVLGSAILIGCGSGARDLSSVPVETTASPAVLRADQLLFEEFVSRLKQPNTPSLDDLFDLSAGASAVTDLEDQDLALRTALAASFESPTLISAHDDVVEYGLTVSRPGGDVHDSRVWTVVIDGQRKMRLAAP